VSLDYTKTTAIRIAVSLFPTVSIVPKIRPVSEESNQESAILKGTPALGTLIGAALVSASTLDFLGLF